MKLHVVIERDELGYFVAEVPALPGCLSQPVAVAFIRARRMTDVTSRAAAWRLRSSAPVSHVAPKAPIRRERTESEVTSSINEKPASDRLRAGCRCTVPSMALTSFC